MKTSKKTYLKVKLSKNEEQIKYSEGQIFANIELVKTYMKEYDLQYRKNVYLKKSEKKRNVIKCMVECLLHMRFIKSSSLSFFQPVSKASNRNG